MPLNLQISEVDRMSVELTDGTIDNLTIRIIRGADSLQRADVARMIAAAPKMFAALDTMVKAFNTYAPKTEGAEYNCVIEARAALTAALGEPYEA